MRAVVSGASVLVCDQGDAIRRLATSSPGTSLSLSPEVSSVLNISERAVASQSSWVRPEVLWKPSTATDLRTGMTAEVAEGDFPAGCERFRNAYHPTKESSTSTPTAP